MTRILDDARSFKTSTGYYYFLETIQNPAYLEHNHMLEWVGGSFDPEDFDIDEINQKLRKIR